MTLTLVPAPTRPAEVDSFAVIVNGVTPVDDLSMDQLRRIYRGDQQYWRDGTKIVVLIHHRGTDERQAVLTAILRMSEAEYKEFWITRIFRSEVTSGPKVVADSRSLIDLVRSLPGAIGVVRSSEVPRDVRVLTLAGKSPGTPGYLLD